MKWENLPENMILPFVGTFEDQEEIIWKFMNMSPFKIV